jgi:hypothetical protein
VLFDLKQTIEKLNTNMILKQQNELLVKCSEKPKLRTFIKFKDFYSTPAYLTKPLSFLQRKFIAKIRLGCLEIRLETGRWARPRLEEAARICQVCENQDQKIENEIHFVFECDKYQTERNIWLEKLAIPENFLVLPQAEKLHLVLNHPSNVKPTAQYIIDIFDIRSKIINNQPSINNQQSTNYIFHLLPHDQCPACNSNSTS